MEWWRGGYRTTTLQWFAVLCTHTPCKQCHYLITLRKRAWTQFMNMSQEIFNLHNIKLQYMTTITSYHYLFLLLLTTLICRICKINHECCVSMPCSNNSGCKMLILQAIASSSKTASINHYVGVRWGSHGSNPVGYLLLASYLAWNMWPLLKW